MEEKKKTDNPNLNEWKKWRVYNVYAASLLFRGYITIYMCSSKMSQNFFMNYNVWFMCLAVILLNVILKWTPSFYYVPYATSRVLLLIS